MQDVTGDIRIVLFVINEDRIIHTKKRPRCSDPTCPCHDEDTEVRVEQPRPVPMVEGDAVCQK